MKCPKCGFNSFEFYDSCKRCSSDLTSYKQTYSITSLVLPLEAKEKLTAGVRSAESATDQISESTETHGNMFSFDLPEDSVSDRVNDPFDFDTPSSEFNQSSNSRPVNDMFADLLEPTSQIKESLFTAKTSAPPDSAAAAGSNVSSGSDEYDLKSFSWDDAPAEAAADSKEEADDFDALFGDTKEDRSK